MSRGTIRGFESGQHALQRSTAAAVQMSVRPFHSRGFSAVTFSQWRAMASRLAVSKVHTPPLQRRSSAVTGSMRIT